MKDVNQIIQTIFESALTEYRTKGSGNLTPEEREARKAGYSDPNASWDVDDAIMRCTNAEHDIEDNINAIKVNMKRYLEQAQQYNHSYLPSNDKEADSKIPGILKQYMSDINIRYKKLNDEIKKYKNNCYIVQEFYDKGLKAKYGFRKDYIPEPNKYDNEPAIIRELAEKSKIIKLHQKKFNVMKKIGLI